MKRIYLLVGLGVLIGGCASSNFAPEVHRVVERDGKNISTDLPRGKGFRCLLIDPAGYKNSPPTIGTISLIANKVVDKRVISKKVNMSELDVAYAGIRRGIGGSYIKLMLSNIKADYQNVLTAAKILQVQDDVCLNELKAEVRKLFVSSANAEVDLVGLDGRVYGGRAAKEYLEDLLRRIEIAHDVSRSWYARIESKIEQMRPDLNGRSRLYSENNSRQKVYRGLDQNISRSNIPSSPRPPVRLSPTEKWIGSDPVTQSGSEIISQDIVQEIQPERKIEGKVIERPEVETENESQVRKNLIGGHENDRSKFPCMMGHLGPLKECETEL